LLHVFILLQSQSTIICCRIYKNSAIVVSFS
jgi:hypothetical protein